MRASVCLAAYNGQKFIKAQVESILRDIGEDDELLIADDASSDRTLEVLSHFTDRRLRVIRNSRNLGHVRNFEYLVGAARNEVLFLSDQDDVWCRGKYQVIMSSFAAKRAACMVYHALTPLQDAETGGTKRIENIRGGIQHSARLLLREFIRPRVFGCGVAIRRSLVPMLLPFPSCAYAHDHWITILSACAGKVLVVDQELVYYRQHSENLTPRKRRSVGKIIADRYDFAKMICIALLRTKKRRFTDT